MALADLDSDDLARVIYLGLLLTAVAGSFIAGNRQSFGKTAQQALIWAFLFLAAIAVAGLWPDIRRQILPREAMLRDGNLEILAAGDGHFYLQAEVNGTAITFMVDTGASAIVLTATDAERAGFDPAALAYTDQAQTANGTVASAPIRLDSLRLGPFEDRDLAADVNGGDLDISLLGMSYLGLYDLNISANRLLLRR